MNAASNYNGAATATFFTMRRRLLGVDPNDLVSNKYTRMRTLALCITGIVELAKRGISGEMHQLSVMAAGCSTSLELLDGDRPIFVFPVLQTGSFKLEAAFSDGLRVYIASAADAPPNLTLNWRVHRARVNAFAH